MIDDPDESGYRYPQVGERLWHRPSGQWVIVVGQPSYGPIEDEVAVRREDIEDSALVVKLKSLVDSHQDMLAAWRSLR